MVFDEKPIMYPSLTEMITADGRTFREILEEKVSALVEILNYHPKYYYFNSPMTKGINVMVGLSIDIDKLFK